MTSRSVSEGAPVHPESSPEDSIKDKLSNYRHPSVYDAVAGNCSSSLTCSVHSLTGSGRISAGGFIPKHLVVSTNRDTASSSTAAIPQNQCYFEARMLQPDTPNQTSTLPARGSCQLVYQNLIFSKPFIATVQISTHVLLPIGELEIGGA